jgi:catalase
VWASDGEMVRAAYTLHAEDDDYGQANTMVNQVLDDDARERLVNNVAGHAAAVNRDDILQRVFEYWRNIDKAIGDRIEAACLEKRAEGDEVKLLD